MKEAAKIYGKASTKLKKKYQVRINEASEQLCMQNPSLLSDRQLLLESARKAVDSGYIYKKEKPRSRLLTNFEQVTPKRKKISADVRLERNKYLGDQIEDLTDRLRKR